MSRLLERKTSFPLLPYQDSLERHSSVPSPFSTFTAPSSTTEDDELPSHRVSLETVSSVFNHDEYETEELLKESDQRASVSTSWFTRRKSWCLSGHVKTRLNSFLIIFLAIIPSFFQKSDKRKCYPTSYLDGLRGVAALFVTQDHFLRDWFPILPHGYGTIPGSNHIIQLPILRSFYSGSGMVTIFFLISGYVLSHKSLRLMRSREFAAILDTLASSVFRRGIRLFLPIIASSFLSLLFELARLYPRNPWPPLTLPGHETSWIAQICDWFLNVLEILNPFQNINIGDPHPPPYDAHLWTIPVEFRGSIVIFLVLLALAKARNGIRLLIVGMLVFYVLWIGHWEMGLFLGGTFLADLQFLRRDLFPPRPSGLLDSPESPTPHPFLPKSSILHHHKILLHLLTIPLFLLGLFLVSFPDLNSESTPGYIHIHAWTPLEYRTFYLTQKFWDTVGALILLTAISFSPPVGSSDDGTPLLQMPFNTRLAQYLGDISFSLYLVHGPMIYGFGWAMLQDSKQQSPEIYWWGFVKCFAVVGGLSLWGADLFMRFIDVPSVGFGKWLADKGWVNE